MSDAPTVVFVCVSNRGKSVMAEALMREHVPDAVTVSSAGTAAQVGGSVNELSAQVLDEVGIDVTGHRSRQLTDEIMTTADLVVVVGTAPVDPPAGVRVERWETDEPSLRGIDGVERMRMIRDDIAARVVDLATRLTVR
ncbi:arsenate-mycothiol transferase ArsC [Gordonia sp. NPDC003424]